MCRVFFIAMAAAAASAAGEEFQTPHFHVTAPTAERAEKIGSRAEVVRASFLADWFPREKVEWLRPCKIALYDVRTAPPSVFEIDSFTTEITISLGPGSDTAVDSLLRQNICRAVFAGYYPVALPAWLEEGIAFTAADPEERKSNELTVRKLVLQDHTSDVWGLTLCDAGVLYSAEPHNHRVAESHSLVAFLLKRESKKRFVNFIDDGLRRGWNTALQSHYQLANPDHLEAVWLDSFAVTRKASR